MNPGIAQEIEPLLEEPPRSDRLDFGMSLSLLVLAGMAMAFMGTVEFEQTTKEMGEGSDATRETSTRVTFKGSQRIPELVGGMLGRAGLGSLL